jgi:hypothetical protein
MENYFVELNNINVNEHAEQKNGLTYLSWAWAWGEVKKKHPDACYTVYENENGWNYHTDGKTCWVKTGVTVNGIEHIEYLPVMDYRNKSISAGDVTSFDVNKAVQRSLTKACARHGLGLYIYAGEDLPEAAAPGRDAAKKAGAAGKAAEEKKAAGMNEGFQKVLDEVGRDKVAMATAVQIDDIIRLCRKAKVNGAELLAKKGKAGWNELTEKEARGAIGWLNERVDGTA